MHLPEDENSHIAEAHVTVLPGRRREGVGSGLIRSVVPEVRAAGRRLVSCGYVTSGTDGEAWATGELGFRVVDRTVVQLLTLAEVDHGLWDVPEPDGYRLERWVGSAPDRLVDSFARARAAIHDAPVGDSSHRQPEWDAQRVRAEEADWAERDFEYVVVAACDRLGEVAGFTELAIHPSHPEKGMQLYTAVLRQHRGHGIGRSVKASMLRWLVAERPTVEWTATGTGAENVHMIQVNEQLGYIITRSTATVEAETAALAARLGV